MEIGMSAGLKPHSNDVTPTILASPTAQHPKWPIARPFRLLAGADARLRADRVDGTPPVSIFPLGSEYRPRYRPLADR